MHRFFTFGFLCFSWLLTWPALAAPPASPTLEFVENKGQWTGPARYAAALPNGGQLFAEPGGLRLAVLADGALDHAAHAKADAGQAAGAEPSLRGHVFDLRWVQASPTAELSARVLTPEHRNYLRGNDPKQWAHDVRSYRELRYAGLWPGIDARFYENEKQQLEYDLELAPGADPAAIGLRHDGATATLDAAGNLRLATTVGVVQELAPRAWQLDAAGQRRPVACRYRLGAAGEVRFVLGAYDRTRPLTIDPTLLFATYSGSTANNWGYTATYDAQGNLYSGGIAFSLGYPVSPGAFQTLYSDNVDMALIKYSVTQSGPAARVWATYLGGSLPDYPHSLVVNGQGELLVLGTTGSVNFPTTGGAVQRTFGGGTYISPFNASYSNGSDLVVSRLSADGTRLEASTFLGGTGNDGLVLPGMVYNYGDYFRGDIQVDAAGGVYVASVTASSNFPLGTGSSFQRTYQGGGSDAVVCKLDAALSAVQWGGYLGGTGTDAAYSLQVAATTGEVYVAGGTTSPALPATTGALNATARGGTDGFVARLAAGGGSVVRTTYLGTSAYDQAFFLQLGSDGGVYALGQTLGAYPTTPGLYANAGSTQFIHKLAPDLGSTRLATVFGSGRATIDLSPSAFLVDRCDRVYVSGWGGLAGTGNTRNLPTTPGALQTTTDGSDFYLAQFTTGLAGLGYATFYGGPQQEHVDGGTSRFDPRGVVYQAVCACFASSGFPVLPGANYYSTSNGSPNSCNNAAFVIDFQASLAAVSPTLSVCVGSTQELAGSPAGGIWTGPGVSGSLTTGFRFTAPGPGTYSLTYTFATGTCNSAATQLVTVTAPPAAPAIDVALQGSYCLPNGATVPVVPLAGTPAGGTFSGPGVQAAPGGSQVFDPNQVAGTSATVTYTYTYGNNCTVQATRQVTIYRPAAGPDQLRCVDAAPLPLLPATALPGGSWSGPGVSGSAATGFVFTPTPALLGVNVLTYSVPGSGCGSTRRITVVPPDPLVLTPLPPNLCRTDNTRYPLAANPADGVWSGPGVSGAVGVYYFTPAVAGAGTFTLSYSRGALGGRCPIGQTLQVTVDAPVVPVVPADTLLCPNTQARFALRGSPAGGTWSGPGVSGSVATGFTFTAPPGWNGSTSLTLTYTAGPVGCLTTATRRIGVAPAPGWQPSLSPVGCPGDQQLPLALRFTDAAGNAATRWDFGDGSPVQSGAVVTHVYQQVGTFQPRASLPYNNGRCELNIQLAAVTVVNQLIPNIIVPNGSVPNRTFQLPPTGCAPRLQLFSRWGQRVYATDAYHNDWDATGHVAGLYYYLITYPDGHSVKGWLEVVK